MGPKIDELVSPRTIVPHMMSPYLPEAHCTQQPSDRETICEFPDGLHDTPGEKTRHCRKVNVGQALG